MGDFHLEEFWLGYYDYKIGTNRSFSVQKNSAMVSDNDVNEASNSGSAQILDARASDRFWGRFRTSAWFEKWPYTKFLKYSV